MLNLPLRLAIAFIFAGTVWAALPSAASAQANFDCRRPRSESVAIICADPEMSALDRRIDEAYRVAIETAEEPNRVRDGHTAWSNSIAACGPDRPCLTRALQEHLASLQYASERGLRLRAEAAQDRPEAPEEPYSLPLIQNPGSGFSPVTDEPLVLPVESETPAYLEAEEPAPSERRIDEPPLTATPASQSEPSGTARGIFGGGLLLGLVVVMLAALMGTKALAEHSMQQYGWPMILNWWNALHVASVFAFYIGWMFAGPLAGAIVSIGLWLIVTVVNIRKTNLGFGLVMSVVQPLVVWIIFAVVALARNKPKPYTYINRS